MEKITEPLLSPSKGGGTLHGWDIYVTFGEKEPQTYTHINKLGQIICLNRAKYGISN
jgi:hypothetical protein